MIPAFPIDPTEPPAVTGARAFMFAIAHGTAALDDEQIELAIHASANAVTQRDAADAARATWTATRHELYAAQARRRADAAAIAQARQERIAALFAAIADTPDDYPIQDDGPAGGSKVPTHPTPPTPPTPAAIRPQAPALSFTL